MNKLPDLWFVKLLVSLLVLSVTYQLVYTVLFLLLRNMRGILILPDKPIAKAKKLYKTAKVLSHTDRDSDEVIMAVVMAVVLVCPSLVLLFLFEGMSHSIEDRVSYCVGGAVIAFLYAIFFGFNNFVSYFPRSKKDGEYWRQAWDLKKGSSRVLAKH